MPISRRIVQPGADARLNPRVITLNPAGHVAHDVHLAWIKVKYVGWTTPRVFSKSSASSETFQTDS